MTVYQQASSSTPKSWITTPQEHGDFLHAHKPGYATIAWKTGGHREKAYPVSQLSEVLPAVAGAEDVYLSLNRFNRWRKVVLLNEAQALYSDQDYHKLPILAGEDPKRIVEYALELLVLEGIPEPSLAIFSGRGVYLIWLHEGIQRRDLPLWNDCMQRLNEVLKPLGADPRAKDAARLLRIIGTRHSKGGCTVEAITPTGEVRPFGDLAAEILPAREAEVRSLAVKRAASRARIPHTSRPAPLQGYTIATLWEARLSDLERLRELRWFGPLPPGQRDLWLFIAACAVSWIVPPEQPFVLRREIHQLARTAGSWPDEESKKRLRAIFERAHATARGETVEWCGVEVDPRYRFKNQTIIEWLEMTAEEEREMQTIISDGERRRRDRERKEAERRAMGIRSRQEVAAERRAEVLRLHSEGLSLRKIAKALGISPEGVRKHLKAADEQGVSTEVPVVCAPQGAGGVKGEIVVGKSGVKKGEESGEEVGGDLLETEAEVFDFVRAYFQESVERSASVEHEQLELSIG